MMLIRSFACPIPGQTPQLLNEINAANIFNISLPNPVCDQRFVQNVFDRGYGFLLDFYDTKTATDLSR